MRRGSLIGLLIVVTVCPAPVYAQQRRTGRNDTSAEAELQKGIALTRSGRFQEAIPIFTAIRGQVRDAYAADFNLALCYVATGQYPQAIVLLNGLRSGGRENASVENLLSQSLLGNHQPDQSFGAFERAARLTPKDEKLYIYLIESCMDNGFNDVGLKIVEAGLKQLPRSARLVFEHAMLLFQMTHEEIHPAASGGIGRIHTHARFCQAVAADGGPGKVADFPKGPVSLVLKKVVRHSVVGNEDVLPSVEIVVEGDDAQAVRGL